MNRDKICLQVTHWHSPKFHAYFPTAQSYPAILADMLSGAIACIGFTWVSVKKIIKLETSNVLFISFSNEYYVSFAYFCFAIYRCKCLNYTYQI